MPSLHLQLESFLFHQGFLYKADCRKVVRSNVCKTTINTSYDMKINCYAFPRHVCSFTKDIICMQYLYKSYSQHFMFCFVLFLSIPNYTHAENSCANSITSSFSKLWGQRLNTHCLLVEFQIHDGSVISSASLQELASFKKKEKERERWSKGGVDTRGIQSPLAHWAAKLAWQHKHGPQPFFLRIKLSNEAKP